MQKIRIRKTIEFHSTCCLIDPTRNGMEIIGERVEDEDPQTCFQLAKAQALEEIEAELDEWEARLFPPEEEPEIEEEPETENE